MLLCVVCSQASAALALEVQNLRRSTASVSHCQGLGTTLILLLLPDLLDGSRCIMASTKPLIKSCVHDIILGCIVVPNLPWL